MQQFFKFPITLYKAEQYNKWLSSKSLDERQDGEDEIDMIVRQALNKKDEIVEKPEGTEVMVRIPFSEIKKCTFHDIWNMNTIEEGIDNGLFNSCLITLESGEEFLCNWNADKLEQEINKCKNNIFRRIYSIFH